MNGTGQPTPTPGQNPAAGAHERRGDLLRCKVTMTVAAVAIGIAGATAVACGGPREVQATPVRLEATSTPGTNPFMPPVGQDRQNVTPPANAGGAYNGGTPGLYADNGDAPSCDARSLVTNLQADTAKAGAWADVLGIEPGTIPRFVASLTPVLLRSDTSVTTHGYQDGHYVAYPAVLQAGSAVFINSYGEPTVKCFNGDPLTKGGTTAQAGYVGPTWTGFRPGAVTVVQPTQTAIQNHTFVNVDNGSPITRTGKPDTKTNPGPNPDTGPGKNPAPGAKPDPALEAAAVDARKKADTAAQAAAAARANANDKKAAATIFDTEARNLEATALEKQQAFVAAIKQLSTLKNQAAALQAAADANPGNIGLQQAAAALKAAVANASAVFDATQKEFSAAKKAATDARAEADARANQFKFADAAARDAESVQTAAEAEAKKAKDAADKAAGRNVNGPAPGQQNLQQNPAGGEQNPNQQQNLNPQQNVNPQQNLNPQQQNLSPQQNLNPQQNVNPQGPPTGAENPGQQNPPGNGQNPNQQQNPNPANPGSSEQNPGQQNPGG